MTRKEVNTKLAWHIRSKNGFFYHGHRYIGVQYCSDVFYIHDGKGNIEKFCYDGVEITSTKFNGKLVREIIKIK